MIEFTKKQAKQEKEEKLKVIRLFVLNFICNVRVKLMFLDTLSSRDSAAANPSCSHLLIIASVFEAKLIYTCCAKSVQLTILVCVTFYSVLALSP